MPAGRKYFALIVAVLLLLPAAASFGRERKHEAETEHLLRTTTVITHGSGEKVLYVFCDFSGACAEAATFLDGLVKKDADIQIRWAFIVKAPDLVMGRLYPLESGSWNDVLAAYQEKKQVRLKHGGSVLAAVAGNGRAFLSMAMPTLLTPFIIARMHTGFMAVEGGGELQLARSDPRRSRIFSESLYIPANNRRLHKVSEPADMEFDAELFNSVMVGYTPKNKDREE